MKCFEKYADQLDGLLDTIDWGQRLSGFDEKVHDCLSDQAAQVLHETGSGTSIWKAGAYFTGPRLANLAIAPVTRKPSVLQRPVFDPTCGAGDLLLRWADDLPLAPDLTTTLEKWGRLLRGRDLFPEFVRVAKRRLVLKAIARGARLRKGCAPRMDRLFSNLQQGDARKPQPVETRLTLVMNPPFSTTKATDTCGWGSGKVSLAAVLFESFVTKAPAGTRIVAILPDVLRTGTRYERWRTVISDRLNVTRVQPYGRFDQHADIDVFIVEGSVGSGSPISWWDPLVEPSTPRVGEIFDVSVGAVVPHRDPRTGPWFPFATSRTVAPWRLVKSVDVHRRFDGTTVRPPFVLVRRTSSPRDAQRAVASIVVGNVPVAVENHLLIAKPKHGGVAMCETLLKNFRNPMTKVWLDERIRCRHLTVGVLREVPLWEGAF